MLHERWRERADKDRYARARARVNSCSCMTYTSRISSRYVYCAARLERVLFIGPGVCVFFCGLHVARPRLVRKGRPRDFEAGTTFSKARILLSRSPYGERSHGSSYHPRNDASSIIIATVTTEEERENGRQLDTERCLPVRSCARRYALQVPLARFYAKAVISRMSIELRVDRDGEVSNKHIADS